MSTQAQYQAEFNNLRSQSFWDGLTSEQLKTIAAMSLGGGGSGGGGTSNTTEATQLAVLAELQKRTTIQIVQNLAIGANTIVHNIGLVSPFVSTKTVVDNATGTPIAVPISGDSANSFVITSPIAYSNVRITIRS